MVNFPTYSTYTRIPDCDSHNPALFNFFLSSDARICSKMPLPPLGNSDMLSQFPLTFRQTQNEMPCFIV